MPVRWAGESSVCAQLGNHWPCVKLHAQRVRKVAIGVNASIAKRAMAQAPMHRARVSQLSFTGGLPGLLWGCEMRSDNNWQFATIRIQAFTGEGVRAHNIALGPDGRVRVWDSVAGHYTLAHALSDRAINRIRSAMKGD